MLKAANITRITDALQEKYKLGTAPQKTQAKLVAILSGAKKTAKADIRADGSDIFIFLDSQKQRF